jgi:hypothetical protein
VIYRLARKPYIIAETSDSAIECNGPPAATSVYIYTVFFERNGREFKMTKKNERNEQIKKTLKFA